MQTTTYNIEGAFRCTACSNKAKEGDKNDNHTSNNKDDGNSIEKVIGIVATYLHVFECLLDVILESLVTEPEYTAEDQESYTT